MPCYYIVRLGADSVNEIRRIDAIHSFAIDLFSIEVRCKQVPVALSPGDVAIIWLGTNNNKGEKTPWIQGIRALGRIEEVRGDFGYNLPKTISISVGVVLPRSVTKMDIVTEQSTLYPSIAGMPVLGVFNYSSQVVQQIDPEDPVQSLPSLFYLLEGIVPGFAEATSARYPELRELFEVAAEHSGRLEERSRAVRSQPSVSDAGESGGFDGPEAEHDGLDPEETDAIIEVTDAIIEVPFDPTKIDITAKPMTISTLQDRLENAELDLTPDFQRQANIWDRQRKARLIESILLKIPLPSFYFSEDRNGVYSVVDGLQRLCAVFHFKDVALLNRATGANLPPLRLKGLQYLKELEEKAFTDLDRKFQRRISELEIAANIIRANTPSAVKFNVFARLNQGGLPLSPQEIRNAIFPGVWRKQLRELAESQEFLLATDGKVPTVRQQDMELVLRYVALWQLPAPHRRRGAQKLDEFLNVTVEETLLHWSMTDWARAKEAFFKSIEATSSVLEKHAFRKSVGGPRRKPINRGLFEAEMIVFGELDPISLSELANRRSRFERLLGKTLQEDNPFTRALLYATGSPESSNARIDALQNLIRETIDAG